MLRRRVLAAVNAPLVPPCCAATASRPRRWCASSTDDDEAKKHAAAERQYTFMKQVSSPLADHLDPRTGRPLPFPGVAASVEVNMAELYELDSDSLLGHGNFGVVHAGTDMKTGRRVAIKAISKVSRGYSPELVAAESNILAKVDHPCATGLLGTHEDRAYHYVVSPLYEGGELFDTLIARGHLSEADAAYITRQLLEVLEHCHGRRIVHRDLKPENILLRHRPGTTGTHAEELAIAVVDFGVAAIMQPGQRLTARCGSAHYMAPEVIMGSYTQSAELWSVGVILYILLSGEMPFSGVNSSAIFSRVKLGKYKMEAACWEAVSPEAKDLLNSLLRLSPGARPSATAALQHPWLNGAACSVAKPLAPSIVDSLIQHQAARGLRRAVLKALIPLVSKARLVEASLSFHDIDTNSDGSVSKEEFSRALQKIAPAQFGPDGFDLSEIERLFDQLDPAGEDTDSRAGDGVIDMDEWLVAALAQKEFSEWLNVDRAFAHLDTNGDGVVDTAELAAYLQRSAAAEAGASGRMDLDVEKMLSEWPDEGISLHAFHALLAGPPNDGGLDLFLSGVAHQHLDDMLEDARGGNGNETVR